MIISDILSNTSLKISINPKWTFEHFSIVVDAFALSLLRLYFSDNNDFFSFASDLFLVNTSLSIHVCVVVINPNR